MVTIHGGMLRDEHRKVEERFRQDKDVRILIATDAAGEGINLQRAHLMINYDLPWNPNRLEQRFGRIHRIGQTEGCHLWNLVSQETREGMVFQCLFNAIQDGVVLPTGNKRIISKNVHFVELKENGTAVNAGYAPYLDYRATTEEEYAAIQDFVQHESWLTHGVEERAQEYAISEIIPPHFAEVKAHKLKMLDKIAKAVKDRMT